MKNDIVIIFQENYSENNEKIKSNLKSIIDYLIKKLGEEINYPALNISYISYSRKPLYIRQFIIIYLIINEQ